MSFKPNVIDLHKRRGAYLAEYCDFPVFLHDSSLLLSKHDMSENAAYF